MSANDWHSHAAQVRPLHPVPTPRAEVSPSLSETPVFDGLAEELTALTRVLLGLDPDLPAVPAAPAGRVVVDTEPATSVPGSDEPTLALVSRPDVEPLVVRQSVLTVPPAELETLVLPELGFVPQPIVEVEPPKLPELTFVPRPIVEVEPLVSAAPVPTASTDDAWPDLMALSIIEPEALKPEPERPRAVRLDDLAFLDL